MSVPAEASKVQVKADPDPHVVDATSVESKLMVRVPALLSEVSIPLVPPAMVRVPPRVVVDVPRSPAKVIEELTNSPLSIEVPKVVTKVLPATERPVPARLVKVEPPMVRDPTEADPVTLALVETERNPVEVEPEILALVETFKNPVEVEPVVVVFPATVKLPVVEKFVAVPDERVVLPVTFKVVPTESEPENEAVPDVTVKRLPVAEKSSATVTAPVELRIDPWRFDTPETATPPEKEAVPAVVVMVLFPNAIEVSVPAEASKVQVKADPDPHVVDATSVESKLMVKVPALLSEVSIPLVPPAMVRVPPRVVVEEPRSPAKVIEELVSSELSMEVPKVVVSAFPTTESPVPANSVMVSLPILMAPGKNDPETERF